MTENKVEVQTKAMADAQCIKEEIANQSAQQPTQLIVDQPGQTPAPANPDNPRGTPSLTPNPDQPNAALNPTVVLTRTDTDNLDEYVRKHGDIGLD